MTPAIVVRPMRRDECEAASRAILRAVAGLDAGASPVGFADRLAAKYNGAGVTVRWREGSMLVACADGVVVGTAALGPERLNTVFVVPEWQGRGIGRRLVAAVEDLAREAGRFTLDLHATATSVPFYRRLGYVAGPDAGERPGVVPMRKRLSPA